MNRQMVKKDKKKIEKKKVDKKSVDKKQDTTENKLDVRNEAKREKYEQLVKELWVSPIMVCWNCLKEKVFCTCWRPTKYDDTIPWLMVEYFETRRQMIYMDKTYYKDWELKSETAKLIAEQFPMFPRFAHRIWVNKDTLVERAKDKDKNAFSVAYNKCKDIQEAILVENWLAGTYVAQMVSFLLKNNHWYKDKSDVDQTITQTWEIVVKFPEV